MLLPELNLPVGFAGKDGFYWWFGQVETEVDPKNSNRHKVRIVGHHVMSCDAVTVDDLPWAVCMFPVTHPAAEGNSTYTPSGLQKGAWVIGFFMDGARGQQPVIMGTLGKVTNSSKDTQLANKFGNDECLAFRRYVPDTNPVITQPAGSKKNDSTARPGTGTNPVGTASVASAASGAEGPAGANPYARFGCVELADAKCDDSNQSKSRFEQILSELFGAVSNNGGQVGTQLLSNVSGKLFDYASAANGYVTRAFGVAKAYLRAGKFKLYSLIKEGVKQIMQFVLMIPKPDIDPKTGEAVKTKKVGVLGKLTTWLNEQLGKINCSIADLEDKVLDFLSDLLYGLLSDIVSGSLCVVEAVVSKILSELESFLTSAIDAILGPLQSVLDIIASPLNIIGAALEYIFTLFGISCSGSGNECAKAEDLTECTGSANKKKPGEDDFKQLDALISNIESDGVTELQTSCEESQSLPCPEITEASIYGGEPDPDGFTGSPEDTPAEAPDDDFDDYFDDIVPDTDVVTGDTPAAPTPIPVNETIASSLDAIFEGSTIVIATVNTIDDYNYPSYGNVVLESASTVQFSPTFTLIETTNYTLTADKTKVSQGETIQFTLTCTNGTVANGTVFNYLMFGFIQASDFADKSTTGSMIMNDNIATKNITISDNISIAISETVLFSVAKAGLAVNFDIVNANYDPEDPANQTPVTLPPTFTPPKLGTPEVDQNGQIISIPILDPGDPYRFPPFVNITGQGFGASASTVLDENGKLSKIVIQRPGINYVPNKKATTNCFIDGFVVIRPGAGYTADTIILVDGERNIVRPVLNSAGNIIDVEVINKVKTYDNFPRIEIIGGGSGAKMIPSLSCLDTPQYTRYVAEIAPSETASVIDCP